MEGVGKPPSIEWSILKAVSLSNGIKNGLNQLFSWGEYLFGLDPARGSKKMWMWESSAETLAEFGVQERAGGVIRTPQLSWAKGFCFSQCGCWEHCGPVPRTAPGPALSDQNGHPHHAWALGCGRCVAEQRTCKRSTRCVWMLFVLRWVLSPTACQLFIWMNNGHTLTKLPGEKARGNLQLAPCKAFPTVFTLWGVIAFLVNVVYS